MNAGIQLGVQHAVLQWPRDWKIKPLYLSWLLLQLSCFQLRAISNEDGSLMKVSLDAGGPVEQVVAVGGQRALRESPLDAPLAGCSADVGLTLQSHLMLMWGQEHSRRVN